MVFRFHTVTVDLEHTVSAVKPRHIIQIEWAGTAFVFCRIADTGSQGAINQRQLVYLAAALLLFAGLINSDHGSNHRIDGILIAFVQLPVLGDQTGFTLSKRITRSFQTKELLQSDAQHITNHGQKTDIRTAAAFFPVVDGIRLGTNFLSKSFLLHALILPVEANPVTDNGKRRLFDPLSGFHINDVSFICGLSFNLSAGHDRPSFHGRHMYDSLMIVHNLCIVNNI